MREDREMTMLVMMKHSTLAVDLSISRNYQHSLYSSDPDDSENMNPDEVNKSLRLTANAIQNYSFDKVDKLCDISMPSCDLADEKDSGISQLSADGLGPAGLEEKLALLDLGLETGGRVATNGRGRGPQAMDDMLYGSSSDSANMGKTKYIFWS